MSRPSPVKARQIIEDAFRRIDRELKKPYRSEYPVNTGVPFLKLGYDVYAIILNKLTGDRIFDVSAQMRRDNAPKALRRVNIQMNAITREVSKFYRVSLLSRAKMATVLSPTWAEADLIFIVDGQFDEGQGQAATSTALPRDKTIDAIVQVCN